jgi:LAS superfamily LD-carboxypeptidase LdcB
MRPDVASAFDRMAAAARAEAGLALLVTSGYRSDAEQAALFAAHPDPKWVAPPGTSLHRYGTELDLGPPAAYGWLAANAGRFRFVKRYAWEPWHYELRRAHNRATPQAGSRGGGSCAPWCLAVSVAEPSYRRRRSCCACQVRFARAT